jgi:hypothetical protein
VEESTRGAIIDTAKQIFIVTIFGTEQKDGNSKYRNSIMAFDSLGTEVYGRPYENESEMIQIVNSVLPDGDIRNALHLVRQIGGYTIHLLLTESEAELLGYGLPV